MSGSDGKVGKPDFNHPAVPPSWVGNREFSQALSKFRGALLAEHRILSPKIVAELGVRKIFQKKRGDFHYSRTLPLYLQPTWAERKAPHA